MHIKCTHHFKILCYFFICNYLLSSCATIFSGTTQNVKIKSNPGNAKVYVNGKDSGILTNGKITIRRAVSSTSHNNTNEQTYKFVKEGYEDLYVRDKRTVNGLALAFDIFFWPGLIVDFVNGSIYKYRKRIDVDLKRLEEINQPEIVNTTKEEVISIQETPQEEKVEPVAIVSDNVDNDIPQTNRINKDAIAILIGNENYSNPDIYNVEYASEDVSTLKNYLIKTMGFREGNIIVFNNASLADFNRVFGNENNYKARLYNLVKPQVSDVFVYYTGHGAPALNNKEAYLVPVECQDISLLQFEGYSLNTLFNNLSEVPYKSLTLVVDACFSGNAQNGMLIKNASPIYLAPRYKLFNKENTVVLTASSGEQIASWYPTQNHSLFTYYFLKYIKESYSKNNTFSRQNSGLSIKEMASYLRDNVSYQARYLYNRTQNPEIYGDNNGFLFKD